MATPSSTSTHSLSSSLGLGLGRLNDYVEEGNAECSDQEQEAIKKHHLHLVSVLPEERGWLSKRIHQYQGFWYNTGVLKGLLILQQHFRAQPSDILLVSYPKSGTTWLKALLFTITTNPAACTVDHPPPAPGISPLLTANPHELVPTLEAYAASNPTKPRPKSSSSLMHTHVPYSSLPESIKASGCRIIYLFRDPKDVLVSCWHFVKKLKPEDVAPISLEAAFEQFCRGASSYGSYWDHVLGYWKAKVERPDRVLLVRYEELKKEPGLHTKRLAEFVGQPFSTEEDGERMASKVVDFCSFEKLSNLEVNKKGSHSVFGFPVVENKIFFRQGEVGDSKNHLTREMMDEMDEITREKWKEMDISIYDG